MLLQHSVHILIEDVYINFTIIWKTVYTHDHNYWSRTFNHSNTKRKHTLNQQLINSLTGTIQDGTWILCKLHLLKNLATI